MNLCIVTATTDPQRALSCIKSWGEWGVSLVVVVNGGQWGPAEAEALDIRATWIISPTYLGTVPAFNVGVRAALQQPDFDIIACFHDDLEILDPDWVKKVLTHFTRHPSCGLAGFGGAIGLGDPEIYQKPYDPMQLARVGFRSNMTNAEAHGLRSLLPERVACLDGFSQVGRREFWKGLAFGEGADDIDIDATVPVWQHLEDEGFRHHAYDSYLGVVAKRFGWDAWYLPIACHHFGGRTAVGDRGYQAWAAQQVEGGDHGFWTQAHEIFYRLGRNILPIRL
jgi:hypothetical protein